MTDMQVLFDAPTFRQQLQHSLRQRSLALVPNCATKAAAALLDLYGQTKNACDRMSRLSDSLRNVYRQSLAPGTALYRT